jgi:6-phosphogluconate dehydrogenase
MTKKFALGILGLGVMGRSLAKNFARNGYDPIGYDISPKLPDDFNLAVSSSVEKLIQQLKTPRILLLMVPAGDPVDMAVKSLTPHLEDGDIIIDGGNSHFLDTNRRVAALAKKGIRFVGMGVSGGEQGALWGPSLMPGGDEVTWESLQPMLEAIAAKTESGEPCVDWMGRRGAGHFVKMVHNGIEYGDMQLIAEAYDLLHRGAGLSNQACSAIFEQWNRGALSSYLIEITANILKRKDEETGGDLIDHILDEATQKGTGKWTSQSALDVGVPIPTIDAAVESRLISALKAERVIASKQLGVAKFFSGDKEHLITIMEDALLASKITSYAQGIKMLQTASKEYDWNLSIARIVRVWRAGCIIRADLLEDIVAAFDLNPDLMNLMLDEVFKTEILKRVSSWREVVQTAVGLGIPLMATGDSLAYFDAYRSRVLPANLTQAQRDYFGAHTYHRIDQDGVYHTQWV